MSEENCCVLGHLPKVFSYIKDGKYVHTLCRLKKGVDCFELSTFFNMLYRINLDVWDANFLENNYSTGDLIKCFHNILEEKNLIDLRELCFFISGNDVKVDFTIIEIVKKFFEMFDFFDVSLVDLDCYNDIKMVVYAGDELFYKEVESIFYNTIIVDMVSSLEKSKVKLRVS